MSLNAGDVVEVPVIGFHGRTGLFYFADASGLGTAVAGNRYFSQPDFIFALVSCTNGVPAEAEFAPGQIELAPPG